MNPHRKSVMLWPSLVKRCRKFGDDMAAWYATPEGKASPSRSRSGDRGTESNAALLGQSKAGECAVAIFCGLPPKTAVKWSVGKADGGADMRLRDNAKPDVKTTESWKRFLIWSRNVNDLFRSKQFDLLISVSINERDWSECWIEGFVSKQEFWQRKRIADGGRIGKGLERGTYFMDKAELHDAGVLRDKNPFAGFCECGAAGLYLMYEGFTPKGRQIWFCQEHKR